MWVDRKNCGPVKNNYPLVIAAYVEKHLQLQNFPGVRVSADGVVVKITFTQRDQENGLFRAIQKMEDLHNEGYGENEVLFNHVAQDCMRESIGGGLFGPKRYEMDIVCHQPNERGVARLREKDTPGVLAAVTTVTNRGYSLN